MEKGEAKVGRERQQGEWGEQENRWKDVEDRSKGKKEWEDISWNTQHHTALQSQHIEKKYGRCEYFKPLTVNFGYIVRLWTKV